MIIWNKKISLLCFSSGCSGGGYVAYADANSSNGAHAVAPPVPEIRKKKVVVIGTGWAGTSFLKKLNNPSYDVQVISPRNYFAFTPLLPSVTCGTVEARSIVEPIRSIVRKVMRKRLLMSLTFGSLCA
jgi:NADH:ubiquinone reductase (non-electrogenic)